MGASRLVYHAGRLATYAALGVLFGALGHTFALVGMQRWVSIVAGVALLAGLLVTSRRVVNAPIARLVIRLKSLFGRVLQKRTLGSQFFLGALNGLLPCGLVYIAAAGAATTLSPASGALHMAAFGVGTLPILLGVSAIGGKLRPLATHAPRLIPISVAVVALLLVMRGMALGIPYLSPALEAASAHHCH